MCVRVCCIYIQGVRTHNVVDDSARKTRADVFARDLQIRDIYGENEAGDFREWNGRRGAAIRETARS